LKYRSEHSVLQPLSKTGIGIRYFEISDTSDIQKISCQKMTKKYQKKKDKKISEKK